LPDPGNRTADDGLPFEEIKPHSLDKHSVIAYCLSMWAGATLNKWQSRVYIDLFSGPGLAKVKTTGEIVKTSPMIALEVDHPFNRYIFCDKSAKYIQALEERVKRIFPKADVRFIEGDCNAALQKIFEFMPAYGPNNKVLSFCLADPYKSANLCFSTINGLSRLFIDFFVLIPDSMDIQRNVTAYLRPKNKTIEEFIGNPDWRGEWEKWKRGNSRSARPGTFPSFIREQFGKKMKDLRYETIPASEMVQVTQAVRAIPLYKLAFYSRSEEPRPQGGASKDLKQH
jgi:three-Cys-motif partner protein